MEWLKQHVLLLNITTGFSATMLVIMSMPQIDKTETQHNAMYRKEREKEACIRRSNREYVEDVVH